MGIDQGLDSECREPATAEVAQLIQDLRPDVVVTFGPDGVSGHTDHLAISRIVVAAHCHHSQRHLQPLTPDRESVILTAPEDFHRAVPPWTGGAPESRLFGLPDAASLFEDGAANG